LHEAGPGVGLPRYAHSFFFIHAAQDEAAHDDEDDQRHDR
jgi:hypothetical protein